MAVWKDLVVCGVSPINKNPDADALLPLSDSHHLCRFADFIVVTNNLIQDLIVVATILTTMVFIWAGLKLVSATFTGNTKALDEAKKIFKNVLTGYIVILVAWLIVYTILHALVDPKYWLIG